MSLISVIGYGASIFLQLPVEVFDMILSYVGPTELLRMAKIDRSTRRLIFSPPMRLRWKKCVEAIGMPACPPTLSEPEYLSIWFEKTCSNCGSVTNRRPDTRFCVRLCLSCMDVLLIDSKLVDPPELRDLVLHSNESRTNKTRGEYQCLRSEVEEAREHLESFDDQEALSAWKAERTKSLKIRRKNATIISSVISETHECRKDSVRLNHYEEVIRRLRALGRKETDEDIVPNRLAAWREMVYSLDVLTEEKWKTLGPRLIEFLDQNAKDWPIVRREACESRLRELHDTVCHLTQLPLDILDLPAALRMLADWLPPPQFEDMCDSLTYQYLLNGYQSVEAMEAKFMQCRDHIIGLISDWSKGIKSGWINILKEARSSGDHLKYDWTLQNPRPQPGPFGSHVTYSRPQFPQFPQSPSTKSSRGTVEDPLKDIDSDSQLLFLPGSLFRVRAGSEFITRTYTDFALSLSRGIPITPGKLELSNFGQHPAASDMAHKLLASNLVWIGDIKTPALDLFECARCDATSSSGVPWSLLINHFLQQEAQWKNIRPCLPKMKIQGTSYVHEHELNRSQFTTLKGSIALVPRRGIRNYCSILDACAATESQTSTHRYTCQICRQVGVKDPFVYNITDMQVHLRGHGLDAKTGSSNYHMEQIEPDSSES